VTEKRGVNALGVLLGTSLVSRELLEAFLAAYVAGTSSPEDFWKSLEEDERVSGEAIAELRFALLVGRLTTVRRGLQPAEDIPGETPEDRLENYIMTLRAAIEALFPPDSLRRALTAAPGTEPNLARFINTVENLDLFSKEIDEHLRRQDQRLKRRDPTASRLRRGDPND
jgi:hypothetical protein